MYPVRRMYYVRTACLHGCALSFVLRTEPSLCAARADWAVVLLSHLYRLLQVLYLIHSRVP